MNEWTDPHLNLAHQAIERGNGQRALEHLAQVTDLDSPRPWQLRAEAFLLLDESEAALEAANRGLEIDPSDNALLLVTAMAHDRSDRPADAERALLAVLNRHPEHDPALFQYAALLLHSGDPVGAGEIVQRIDPFLQTTADVLGLRARIASALGNEREADDLTRLAVEADPDSSHAHAVRAMRAGLRGNPDEAVSAGRRAAALDPEQMAGLGYASKYVSHPLLAPVRWIERIGAVRLWIGWLVFAFVIGPQLLSAPVRSFVSMAYIGLVIYSWTVPFLLRQWFKRQGRL